MYTFKPGDKVRYRAEFLKSIKWYLDVPRVGEVLAVRKMTPERSLVTIKWDSYFEDPVNVLCTNVVPVGVSTVGDVL